MYKRSYSDRDNAYVTLARVGKKLVGQAFFISDNVDGKGRCTWVTQLVVHGCFRHQTIASKLLQSAWGFSDDLAWGLATVNPMTIKTLESSTFRKVNLEAIQNGKAIIESFQKMIPFADDKLITIDDQGSAIHSDFYPKNTKEGTEEFEHYQQVLGRIPNGGEWVAFIFQSQPIQYNKKKWEEFMMFQENQLIDSYSRMNVYTQNWASGHKEEVGFIVDYLENVVDSPITSHSRILDIGCGIGRHLNTLLKTHTVEKAVGIDFSEANIKKARIGATSLRNAPQYEVKDARKYRTTSPYDVVLCLYDVIGSYRDEKDNNRIIQSVKRNLKKGGHAFISVMNMDYTKHVAIHKDSLSNNPRALLDLKPSETMSKTGDVFDPDFFMINTDDGLVYRKEQFRDKKGHDAEYVIADKRYALDEMKEKLENLGLKVLESRYVSAKNWKVPHGAIDAKEILFVVTK